MRKPCFLRAAAALFLLMLPACGGAAEPSAPTAFSPGPPQAASPLPAVGYQKITPQEAQEMMSGDTLVLDVRTPGEFDQGHIKNAVLLPGHEIREKAESLIADKNQIILVYCKSGVRSEAAAKELIDMGYTRVYDFGGILDWPGEIV